MILPQRGEAVDRERRAEFRKALTPERTEQRIEELLARDQIRLRDVFSDDDVHRLYEEFAPDFRDRCFTPAVTLGLFVSQVLSRADACSTVVTQLNQERKRLNLPPVSEDASAYCKARARLPVAMVDVLSNRVMRKMESKTPDYWKWKGLNVYLVDGFVLRAPDTDANQKEYPQPSTQTDGLGFPQVRVVISTSLATGCILHYNTGKVEGKKTGEVTLFREKHMTFQAGDVVVGDSNFESFHDSVLLKRRGVEMVCCINGTRRSPLEEEICETIDDVVTTVKKPPFDKTRFTREQWESLPNSISYRVIRYRVEGRKSEITIVTTLLDRVRFSARDIANLYGLRWDVEVDICSYKSTMGMGELRCQSPENLRREIAVSVLAYNLVRLLTADTAAVLELHPREISFSQARDAWRAFGKELETSHDLMWIILSASSRLVRDRPGRNEPRALKRRNQTKYPKLKEPRPSRALRTRESGKDPPAKAAEPA
jgi:hypothetical protein